MARSANATSSSSVAKPTEGLAAIRARFEDEVERMVNLMFKDRFNVKEPMDLKLQVRVEETCRNQATKRIWQRPFPEQKYYYAIKLADDYGARLKAWHHEKAQIDKLRTELLAAGATEQDVLAIEARVRGDD